MLARQRDVVRHWRPPHVAESAAADGRPWLGVSIAGGDGNGVSVSAIYDNSAAAAAGRIGGHAPTTGTMNSLKPFDTM